MTVSSGEKQKQFPYSPFFETSFTKKMREEFAKPSEIENSKNRNVLFRFTKHVIGKVNQVVCGRVELVARKLLVQNEAPNIPDKPKITRSSSIFDVVINPHFASRLREGLENRD